MGEFSVHRPRSPPKNRIKLPSKVLLRHLPMGSRHLLGGRGSDPGPKIAKILIKKIDLLRHERSDRTRNGQAAPSFFGKSKPSSTQRCPHPQQREPHYGSLKYGASSKPGPFSKKKGSKSASSSTQTRCPCKVSTTYSHQSSTQRWQDAFEARESGA